jgi:hypothetical protein
LRQASAESLISAPQSPQFTSAICFSKSFNSGMG